MIKLIFLILLFLFAITASFIPYIQDLSINWVAWYGALVSLYNIGESYRTKRSELAKSIYITPIISALPQIDTIIKELTVYEKINPKDSKQLESKVKKLQAQTTCIFCDICNLLKKIDKHCSTDYKDKVDALLDEKIYPLFSHLLQYINQQDEQRVIFQKANKKLQNNLLDIQNQLTSFIMKISNKC